MQGKSELLSHLLFILKHSWLFVNLCPVCLCLIHQFRKREGRGGLDKYLGSAFSTNGEFAHIINTLFTSKEDKILLFEMHFRLILFVDVKSLTKQY